MIVCSSEVAVTKNNLMISEAVTLIENVDKKQDVAWYMQSIVLQSANGENQNFYGAATPENPRENDLWFVYDESGHAKDMLKYTGGKWVSALNLEDAKQYIDEAIRLAQKLDADRYEIDTMFASTTELWRQSDEQGNEITTIKGDVNGLQSSVTNLNTSTASSLTQLSDKINLKVGKGEVISQINLEADNATIKSKAIVLAGDTTVTGTFRVPSAQITGQLSAGQISANKLSAISADLGDITAGTLTGVNFVGGVFKADQLNPVYRKFSTQLDGYGIDLVTEENNSNLTLSLVNPMIKYTDASGTSGFSINPRYMQSKGFIAFEDYCYIGGRSGVRVVQGSGLESSSNPITYQPIRASEFNTSNVNVGSASIGVGGTFNGSASTSNTSIGSNNIYIPGSYFGGGSAITSSRDKKKDIETFTDNVLDDVVQMRPVNYRLKTDGDNEAKRLGFILEEMPVVELVDPSGGVDQYALITLAIKSIQELNAKVERLENEIKELKR